MANEVASPVLQKQEASYSVTINASAGRVWQAITDPAIIRQYFYGTEAQSDWQEGSPITWRGEYNGQAYKDKGTILKSQPNKLFQHTYWSSMAGMEDEPDNYITVTYKLEGNDTQTKLTVSQNMCKSKEEAESMWKDILDGLKKTVEKK